MLHDVYTVTVLTLAVAAGLTASAGVVLGALGMIRARTRKRRARLRRTILTSLVVLGSIVAGYAQPTLIPVRERPTWMAEWDLRASRTDAVLACIARIESGGNPRAVSRSGRYHGAWQFRRSTWDSVSNARQEALWPISRASMAEQRRGARRLYELRGLAPWPPARGRC